MNIIKTINQVGLKDIATVGGKGASLGELKQSNFPVPNSFIIPAQIFEQYFHKNLPKYITDRILNAFDNLNAKTVAVRSSGIAEDSLSFSFAGQLESYLHVTRKDLINRIKDCWNSTRSARVQSYSAEWKIEKSSLSLAVIVQQMINSDTSGTIFTVNPVTRKKQEIMIESSYGLGELLVQGLITPDNFIVSKKSFKIKNKLINHKERMLILRNNKNLNISVPTSKKYIQSITNEQIVSLAQIAKKIEDYYDIPQDIEWAIENDIIYILQSRPITTKI